MELRHHFGLLPLTRQEALATGITKRQWQYLCDTKRVIKMHRGVYVAEIATDDLTRYQQKVAAQLKGKTNHCAVGVSALALLGLDNPHSGWWSSQPVTIAGPRSDPGGNVFRQGRWDLADTVWGPCTDPIETAAWAARELALPEALIVADAVARRIAHSTDRFYLASEECRLSVRRRLMEAVELPATRFANPAVESPAESFYRGHMLSMGFREPMCGVPRRGASGSQYFVDMLIDDLVIEVDGKGKYTGLEVLVAEKRREDDLRLTGLQFLRSWVEDLNSDPAKEMRTLLGTYPQVYPHLWITT